MLSTDDKLYFRSKFTNDFFVTRNSRYYYVDEQLQPNCIAAMHAIYVCNLWTSGNSDQKVWKKNSIRQKIRKSMRLGRPNLARIEILLSGLKSSSSISSIFKFQQLPVQFNYVDIEISVQFFNIIFQNIV